MPNPFEVPPVPPVEKPKKKEAAKPRPEDIIKVPVKINPEVVGTEGATHEKRQLRASERLTAVQKAEAEGAQEQARQRKTSERAQAVPKIEKKGREGEIEEGPEEEKPVVAPSKIQRGRDRFNQ